MRLGRFLGRLVKVAASAAASKHLLDTASSGPSIETKEPIGPRVLQGKGPYRSAELHERPTCTSCNEVVVLWCRLCGAPIELGEQVFCPDEKDIMKAAARRAGSSAPVVGIDAVAATAIYDIAIPTEHVHRKCAFIHTTQLFTRAITDLTKD